MRSRSSCSRPATAPLSKFKTTKFTPEIIGISPTIASPRISPTRLSATIRRPISSYTQPSKEQFDSLTLAFDDFAEQSLIKITAPFLVAQFQRFSQAFNQFSDTCSNIKNSFFGNNSERMKIQHSAVIVQAKTMMYEWTEFRDFFVNVKSANIIPIYKPISDCLSQLNSAIQSCYDLCGVGSRFESIPLPFQKFVEEEIKSLRRETICIFNARVSSFDPLEIYHRIVNFVEKTQKPLLQSFFRNRMSTADIMRTKVALSIAYENLMKNAEATQNFDFYADQLSNEIILMNEAIGQLYQSLKVPVSLRKIRQITDDEGNRLNISLLRPHTTMKIDRTSTIQESAKRAGSIQDNIEQIEHQIQNKTKQLFHTHNTADTNDDQ